MATLPLTLPVLDYALRGGAVALLLLTAGLLVRDHPASQAARLGALFAVGVSAYAILSAPGVGAPAGWWRAPLVALASGNAIVFWLFVRALFEDDFRVRRRHALAWTALAATALTGCYLLLPAATPFRIVGAAMKGATLIFALLAIVQSLASWRTDLVEGRRRLRLVVVGAIAVNVLISTAAQLIWGGDALSPGGSATSAFAMAATALLIAWLLVGVPAGGLFDAARAEDARLESATGEPAAPVIVLNAADRKLIQALEQLMSEKKAYRQEKFSIGELAVQLGQPEYKLRRVINQGMGFRNFNTFLNGYRIEEARAVLADPEHAGTSIVDIAMNTGFQSLGPFNRAFKSTTGMTPSEFRRSHAAQNTVKQSDSGIG